jgi:hypothetical protein
VSFREIFGTFPATWRALAPSCSNAAWHAARDARAPRRPQAVAWRRVERSGRRSRTRTYCSECLERIHGRRVTLDGELQLLPAPRLFEAR